MEALGQLFRQRYIDTQIERALLPPSFDQQLVFARSSVLRPVEPLPTPGSARVLGLHVISQI